MAMVVVKLQPATPLRWSLKLGRGLPTPSGAFVWNSERFDVWNGIVLGNVLWRDNSFEQKQEVGWNLWFIPYSFWVVTVGSDVNPRILVGNWGCTLHPWYKPPHCEQWETSSRVMTTRHRQVWSLGVPDMDSFRILRRMDLWCSFQKVRFEKNGMFHAFEPLLSWNYNEKRQTKFTLL